MATGGARYLHAHRYSALHESNPTGARAELYLTPVSRPSRDYGLFDIVKGVRHGSARDNDA